MRIAIITGVQTEADAFMPGTYDRLEQHGGLSIRFVSCATHDVAISCCGVGKVNAAMAATLLAAVHQTELLMIIGTAGKLGSLAGDCFIIHEAVQGDYGAQRSDGFVHYTAGAWPIGPAEVTAFFARPLPDIGLPQARIVTGDAFIECPDHSLRLRDGLAGDLVDMETGAVAQVATRLGLPWSAIKATTDDANGESVSDFDANLLAASRRAARAAEQAIHRM
ncbi:purine phosphorylase [Sphingobium subterraneum]|uniref:Adenosylhomocysteine nucleosidase n=1 Tax=Sphingobium subterraneum TaxID=627688 RepID=A0A841J0A6_9SPHN|nr:purine phosphorylase [Sphingobium subterraneum]MBB6122956.1 adenosylhomocysteine nucleosidase [Sphingobium subterraneum]